MGEFLLKIQICGEQWSSTSNIFKLLKLTSSLPKSELPLLYKSLTSEPVFEK